MKMLVHRESVSDSQPFLLAALKSYLRMDSADDDLTIANIGYAAAQEIEKFAQIALLTQTVRVTIFGPIAQDYGINLPFGPVIDGAPVIVTIDGVAFTGFEVSGGQRPHLRWLASYHDLQPDRINIEYQAGFGEDHTSIPKDLSQAILDQAALLYDHRSPVDSKSLTTSPHMTRIGARYRGVSL